MDGIDATGARAVAYPWLPGLYVVATSLIAIDLLVAPATRNYSLLGLALVLLGVPVYYIWKRIDRASA